MPIVTHTFELLAALSNRGIQVELDQDTMCFDLYVPTRMLYVHAGFMHNALYMWGDEDGVEKVLHYHGLDGNTVYARFLEAVEMLIEDSRRPAYLHIGE